LDQVDGTLVRKHNALQHDFLQPFESRDTGRENAADEVQKETDSRQPPGKYYQNHQPE